MALNVKYKLLQNLWDPISDINTYWSKALQRLALIFMGLKFLIQTVKLLNQNSWACNTIYMHPGRMRFEENTGKSQVHRVLYEILTTKRCKRPRERFLELHNSLANICAPVKIANPIN